MSNTVAKLRGITWNHSRGYVPMVATAQRFEELHPGVEIHWEKRSLQAFADHPIAELTERYDLLVIDHPWAGFAADSGVLLDLAAHLPAEFMADQAANTVGKSHASYDFDGYHCALAIDAATPVASYRPDLLAKLEMPVPETWEDLLALARRGAVAMPGIPLDTLMNFYMICSTMGQGPFVDDEWIVDDDTGVQALEMLRELASLCTPEIFEWNPIAVYNALSSRGDLAYCPFAYGYSNYARSGYANKLLRFTDMVAIDGHGRCVTTLGGTGLAISATTPHRKIALDYAQFVASPSCQRTLYADNSGQPGHRQAWLDPEVNRRTHNFFLDTLPALDRAYLRPRYSGYLHFQDHAGDPVQAYVRNGGNPKAVLRRMEQLYAESKKQV
ncbi:MAG: extracellular solute-binding protein [Caldilineae bacterium]|nr:MAG: extracellular solute-binding protein [Caldilineae bacterium]